MRAIIAGVLTLSILLAIFTAGCTSKVPTSSSNSSSVSSPVTPPPNNLDASEFSKQLLSVQPDITIVKPFEKSVNEQGHIVFSGVVRSSDDTNAANDTTVTFEVCKDASDANQTYVMSINNAKQAGYATGGDTNNNDINVSTEWIGYKDLPGENGYARAIDITLGPIDAPFDDYGIGHYVETLAYTTPTS